jgi:uncharacterized membrane protein YhiD involved in acid resistance
MNTDQISSATETVLSGVDQFLGALTGAFAAPADNVEQYVTQLEYYQIILALSIAAILGAFIALHPKRQTEAGGPASDKELKKTLIIIPVAGAIMVALVQGSLERAFGLVGLGSFVRYRTAMRNPVDLSIIFILIGVGMACGLKQYEFAVTITSFLYILLYVLEFTTGAYQYTWLLKVDTTNPIIVERMFLDIAKENQFHIIRIRSSKQGGQFRCRFTAKKQIDTDKLTENIKEFCGEDVLFTRFDWELNKR